MHNGIVEKQFHDYLVESNWSGICIWDDIKFKSNDFMFDFEFTSKVLKKKKWKFSEVDISYKGRTFAEGKKIFWIDGFRALLVILKIKLFY